MTTMTPTEPVRTIPVIEAADYRADLDAGDDQITALDAALRDVACARRRINELRTTQAAPRRALCCVSRVRTPKRAKHD